MNQRLPRVRLRRTVATFHDLFVLTGDYSTAAFRERFAAQARDAAVRADAIIAVSAFTKSQVVSLLGVEPSRIHVVHHGVRELSIPANIPRENVILNVGAIQKRKNIARLVEAFEAVDPSWRLVLIGSDGFGAADLHARINASAARDRIQRLGYVTAEELALWYAKASVFAFPSLDEGFGMPVLEAMAAGLPVLTSRSSALPEVAGDAAVLVEPDDAASIGDGLRQLIDDQDLRETLTEVGTRRARQFTWEKATRETWNVYRTLLDRDE